MAITLTYDTPSDGQLRISGTYSHDSGWGDFSCPIVYNGEAMDLVTTESRTKLTIQESIDSDLQ